MPREKHLSVEYGTIMATVPAEDPDTGDLFGLSAMFSDAGDDNTVEYIKVSRAAGTARRERLLRVADYGAEAFWHKKWAGRGQSAGHEWYAVSAAQLWPVIEPLARELGLTTPAIGGPNPPPRVIELGCGLSNLSLDLVRHHGLRGIVATDVVQNAVDVLRAAALSAGISPPDLSFALENALSVSYGDGSFSLVLDKGCADFFALSNEGEPLAQLAAYGKEISRIVAPGGYFAMVTAWTEDRRAERARLFHPLKLVSTTEVHRHGPAAEHVLVMWAEPGS